MRFIEELRVCLCGCGVADLEALAGLARRAKIDTEAANCALLAGPRGEPRDDHGDGDIRLQRDDWIGCRRGGGRRDRGIGHRRHMKDDWTHRVRNRLRCHFRY